MSKLITVFGSTGRQGGSVVRSLLSHPLLHAEYKIRAVTRDRSKPKAKELGELGVEVFEADLSKAQAVHLAVKDSYAVFGVTDFWSSESAEVEFEQGKNIADACSQGGVKHLIWSSLCHTSRVSRGEIVVEHFDAKAEVEDYIRNLHIPASYLYTGGFMSNLENGISKDGDGNYSFAWSLDPTSDSLPLFSETVDTGKWVASILSKPSESVGKRFFAATAFYTPSDICRIFQKVTGKKLRYIHLDDDAFAATMPGLRGRSMAEAFKFIKAFQYFGPGAKQGLEESLRFLDEAPFSLEEYFLSTGPW